MKARSHGCIQSALARRRIASATRPRTLGSHVSADSRLTIANLVVTGLLGVILPHLALRRLAGGPQEAQQPVADASQHTVDHAGFLEPGEMATVCPSPTGHARAISRQAWPRAGHGL